MGRYEPMREVVSSYSEAEEILDAQEAAALLRVSIKTLLRLARDGALVGRKVGREWRFCRSDVVGFIRGEGRAG
jgi:excisionase family DNA binding protein